MDRLDARTGEKAIGGGGSRDPGDMVAWMWLHESDMGLFSGTCRDRSPVLYVTVLGLIRDV